MYLEESLLEGKKNRMVVRHDASKLQEGIFRKVGMLIGISLVQGGSGFPFFAPSTFSYLCGRDIRAVTVGQDEIPDIEIDIVLDEVKAELDEIKLGLSDAGVLEMMTKHPDLFKPLFVHSEDPLTADRVMGLSSSVCFLKQGHQSCIRSKHIYAFRDLLEELENGVQSGRR
ncbi:hypothetical protein GBAR_LOCUS3366 [Geodia barretti]|uniref:Uncharacterized protein n=1 Tax=Geodia barretti TaxID=519541 RepID=A0AA35R320_GEOBA|nr:hypothetical protein GBAR_LOCUS3366 [Geodia barretti]